MWRHPVMLASVCLLSSSLLSGNRAVAQLTLYIHKREICPHHQPLGVFFLLFAIYKSSSVGEFNLLLLLLSVWMKCLGLSQDADGLLNASMEIMIAIAGIPSTHQNERTSPCAEISIPMIAYPWFKGDLQTHADDVHCRLHAPDWYKFYQFFFFSTRLSTFQKWFSVPLFSLSRFIEVSLTTTRQL